MGEKIFFFWCYLKWLNQELSRLKFSESEEDSGKENKKTTQHETKEVVSNANSKVRIWNFDNLDIMYGKLKVESDMFLLKN